MLQWHVHDTACFERSYSAVLPSVSTECMQTTHIEQTLSTAGPYMHMQSIGSALSTPTCDRAGHTTPPMAALLHADRTSNAASCSGLIEWSMPVGTVMLPAARASTGRSEQWLQHRRRDMAQHTFTCARCRRHVGRRPWCSAGNAHGHTRAVRTGLHRLQSRRHTSAASSIHPWRPAWSPPGS